MQDCSYKTSQKKSTKKIQKSLASKTQFSELKTGWLFNLCQLNITETDNICIWYFFSWQSLTKKRA